MSTGFSFGAKTTAPPTFGATNTLSFGAAPASNQFSFGSNTQQQQQQQQQTTGFQLGSSFNKPTGSVAPQPAAFGFGTPTSSAPNPTGGLGFGATASTAAPIALGTALSFGTAPASTAGPTGFSLNTSGLSFGTPASTGTGLNFNTPQTTAQNLTIGAPAASGTTSGLNFAAPASSGLSFGLGTGTTPTAGFGSTTTTPSSGLGYSLGGINTGLTLGTTSSAATTTPGLSFGAAPLPTLNFGTSTTGSILTSTPSTGLTSGAAPTLNFSSSTNTSAPPTGISFTGSTATGGFSLAPASTSTATPTQKVGLGGIQTSTASSLGTTTAKEVPPKEQQLPNEIQQDIENFKNYIKQQKLYSSDVSRCCVKDFRSVEDQIGVLNAVIKEIESQLQKNRILAEKLKYDTAQGLQLLEMAQRTQDTPAGLQYENVAPMNYFLGLADKFEKEMHSLKNQIESTDKYVKNFGQPATLTSQDLSLGMKRLHDTFVALAGRLQSVHTQVESQKELYTNLRKQLANDFSNPFEYLDKKLHPNQIIPTAVNHSPPKIACGPTPFNQIVPLSASNSQQNVGQGAAAVNPGLGVGSSLPSFFGNTSALNKTNTGFQNTTFGTGTGFQNTSLGSSFQLQKPPTGNKRGKQ